MHGVERVGQYQSFTSLLRHRSRRLVRILIWNTIHCLKIKLYTLSLAGSQILLRIIFLWDWGVGLLVTGVKAGPKVASLVFRFWSLPWTVEPNTQLKWKLRYPLSILRAFGKKSSHNDDISRFFVSIHSKFYGITCSASVDFIQQSLFLQYNLYITMTWKGNSVLKRSESKDIIIQRHHLSGSSDIAELMYSICVSPTGSSLRKNFITRSVGWQLN